MGRSVLRFEEIDQTHVASVGGKGANLGELRRIEGIRVPPGFCVTTDAYRRVVAEAASIDDAIERLSGLTVDDPEAIADVSAGIRRSVEALAIPRAIGAAIERELARLSEDAAHAVRSS